MVTVAADVCLAGVSIPRYVFMVWVTQTVDVVPSAAPRGSMGSTNGSPASPFRETRGRERRCSPSPSNTATMGIGVNEVTAEDTGSAYKPYANAVFAKQEAPHKTERTAWAMVVRVKVCLCES